MYLKFCLILGVLVITSCSKESIIESDTILSPQYSTTRTAGDGIYDVLGYGYDITNEYCGENATKLRILDVSRFVKENPNRFDNPFLGIIDQRCFAGEDAMSLLNQLISSSDFSGTVGSLPENKDKEGFFSGTITAGFKSDSKYFYSSKFSFAKAEIIKKQRQYLLNTDITTLSNYLSPSFIEDLNKYSVDKIVEMYGTHVLTKVIVGGSYTAYYKSTIIEENNRTEKTKIVGAGAKYNLASIGLDANGSWSSTEINERNKKNSKWECHIKSVGGSTSGTTITLTPNQGPTFTVNLGAWTESVDDQHSRLIDVDWNATYPIYDLISDPVKKKVLKEAVYKYINSKKLDMLKTTLVYRSFNGYNHYYATEYKPAYGNGDLKNEGAVFSICSEKAPETIPLYQYFNKREHFYTVGYFPLGIENYKLDGILGYVYPNKTPETVPLGRYFNGLDHYYETYIANYTGYKFESIECYVFP